MDNPMAARVVARRWAEECYESIEDKEAFAERVWQLSGIPSIPSFKPPIVPMTDEEVRAFEKTSIWFGAHSGKPIENVPLHYLCSLTDPPTGNMLCFMEKVKRYLKNPGVRRMLEEEN